MKIFAPLIALTLTAPVLAQEAAGLPPLPGTSAAQQAAEQQLARIATLDDAGPELNAVIVVNPAAPAQARAAEAAGLPLGGMTVLVKDNIETRDMPTTAGSLLLADNATGRDAPLVARIRAAGGVILGKTNLSEWANFRGDDSTSGWSGVGGLTRNPHATDRNACGSSSGSGAAIAAGFAWGAIGTETNGSITCPASINGIVGFKPTVGFVSRTHVVPIAATQDTAGPMTIDTYRAAMLMNAMTGSDPLDPVTAEADARKVDFTEGMLDAGLAGVRIGVMREQIGNRADVAALFEQALTDMERAGAVLVDIEFNPDRAMFRDSFAVLLYEFREGIDAYLQALPRNRASDALLPRSLQELVEGNEAAGEAELRWFGQQLFEQALEATDTAAYETARENAVRIAGEETIDRLLADFDVEFLVAPTRGPAWVSDLVVGDNFNSSIGFGSPAAIAGYPHLTVPMGQVEGLPVGLSIIGAKWEDHAVLKAGSAYERIRMAELPVPTFRPWTPER
ncbi:amidase [Erythrobacter litoralis]|uniref:Amidase family protein n=1 Tax=Erythrobacter litoralis (strain HTCC2594) TaxID=314225 RepID=Q2NDC5_ERYLH|nr:amidase [Erythrobacter litoralis]ABC62316.1 amidase family protein [Erythrobacter litoralis HTCC2594]